MHIKKNQPQKVEAKGNSIHQKLKRNFISTDGQVKSIL